MEDQTIAGIPGTRERADFTFLVSLLDLPFGVYKTLLWAMNEGDSLTQQNKLLTWLFRTQHFYLKKAIFSQFFLFVDVSSQIVLTVSFGKTSPSLSKVKIGFRDRGQITWKTGSALLNQAQSFHEVVLSPSHWPFAGPHNEDDQWSTEISRERFFTILYHFLPKWPET